MPVMKGLHMTYISYLLSNVYSDVASFYLCSKTARNQIEPSYSFESFHEIRLTMGTWFVII